MPYLLKKIAPNCYAVFNSLTGKIHAKCSTKKHAMAQLRLLSDLYYMDD